MLKIFTANFLERFQNTHGEQNSTMVIATPFELSLSIRNSMEFLLQWQF